MTRDEALARARSCIALTTNERMINWIADALLTVENETARKCEQLAASIDTCLFNQACRVQHSIRVTFPDAFEGIPE